MKKLFVMLLLGGLGYVAWRRCAGCCSADEGGWCSCGTSDDAAR
jgi:hypothetical protein